MKYAVNIGDLTKDIVLAQWAVGPVCPGRQVVQAESTLDGGAVLLECDELQGNGIVALIRLRYQKHQLRCYQSKTGRGGWKRI